MYSSIGCHPRMLKSVSVVIPTLNGGCQVGTLLAALGSQSLKPVEVIVIDSGSVDETVSLAQEFGATILKVDTRSFGHGRTRNLGAASTSGELLCFMTQDALPTRSDAIEVLASRLDELGVAAVYGRQVARCDATPVETFARSWNYPVEDCTIGPDDVEHSGIRAYFFSNVFSVIRRDAFERVGCFPDETIMNEDMLMAAKLINSGHKTAYVAGAVVEHSHNYTVWQTLMRYFDIGVFLEQAREDLGGVRATGEGFRYVRALFTTLWRDRQYAWIPIAAAESAAKWVGQFLGKRHKLIPLPLVRRLSMHRNYWDEPL